ncbi:MAG: hypothetical protein AB7P97_20910 [Hyphomonadaceae bacterium]
MTQDWIFHEYDFLFGNNASAYRNALPASGLTTGERFVREVIQNSVDAHDPELGESVVKVVFERRTLVGAQKAAFVKALNLHGELSARREHYKNDKEAPPQLGEFFDHIEDNSAPLSVMMVSDFNTVGLGGRWDKRGQGDNFGRLVLGFGLGDKAESAESTGGSFGFGKTVYTAAAQSGLVAYYSVFEPTEKTGGAHARFMATGVLAQHTADKDYSGFAMFGEPQGDNVHVAPYVDDVAHKLAKSCGIPVRAKGERGTTILVIGAEVDFDEILSAAETHWWPRLLSHTLEVEVREGDKVAHPRPKLNPSLAPFIRCWNALMSGPEDDSTKERPINVFDPNYQELAGKKPGRLMFTAVTPDELAEWDGKESSDAAPSRDRVVLIRSTRMVISYQRASEQHGLPPFAGVFLADDDVTLNKVLTYSEPAAHNLWDWTSERFKKHHPLIGPKVIKSIHARIRQGAKAFQEGLEPPRPKNASSSKTLGKLLGKFLKAPGKTPAAPVPKFKRNVTIHVSPSRVVEGGVEYDVSKIELNLQTDSPKTSLNCRLSLINELLGDDSLNVLEKRDVALLGANGKVLDAGEEPSATITVEKGKPLSFSARAPVGTRDVTRIKVMVDELNDEVTEEAA